MDDALKAHVKELLEKLVNIVSEDEEEAEDEAGANGQDEEYETDEEEQKELDEQNATSSKLTKESFKKSNNLINEEPMEMT